MSMLSGNLINKMITYFDGDVRRINHALKVYGLAKSIAENERVTAETLAVIEAAAILHDIGIKLSEQKYNSSAGSYQEIEGPPVAEAMLRELGVREDRIARISYLIGHHHTYSQIDGIDFQVLVEADFLVNIFEDDIKQEQIRVIRDKYFKTAAGKTYLASMYLEL